VPGMPRAMFARPARVWWSWSALADVVRRRGRPVSTSLRPEDVIALVEAIGPGLRCGLTPAAALSVAIAAGGAADAHRAAEDPMHVVAQRAVEAATDGLAMSAVWQAQARATGSAELTLLSNAWSLTEETGAPLAEAVSTVAAVLRAGTEQQLRLDAALAGPRATMRLLIVLPVAGPVLALVLGVSPEELYASVMSRCSLAGGLLLVLLGRAWVARMIRGVGTGPAIT